MGEESGDLVAHALGRSHSDFRNDPLVDLKVGGEARIVLLNESSGRLFDRLVSNATLSESNTFRVEEQEFDRESERKTW